jgi:hypothetical protein
MPVWAILRASGGRERACPPSCAARRSRGGRPYNAGMRHGLGWRPGRSRDPIRAPRRVQLVCAVCGRILIGLTPERAAVYRKEHEDATGHAVRVEPLEAER